MNQTEKAQVKKSLDIIQTELNNLYKLVEPKPVKEQKKTTSQIKKDYTTENRARRPDEIL